VCVCVCCLLLLELVFIVKACGEDSQSLAEILKS